MWPFDWYPEVQVDDTLEKYSYIIVGGGTAGCVLANRLSADPNNTVLLIERGPRADSWAARVPLFSSDFASDGSRTLKRPSEMQHELGRPILLFSGGALGGTSRINQMLYTRGLTAEYDSWAEDGRKGWGWKDMEQYFVRSERALGMKGDSVHGTGGEWRNRSLGDFQFQGFEKAVTASEALGLPYIPDINSPAHPPFGCGRLYFTIDENSKRNSAYHAFLPSALVRARRANLHICTNALVEKVDIERLPDGRVVARGVVLLSQTGPNPEKRRHVRATREIVLSAGPFGSPHILMLSGVGPSEHLKELGIPIVKDLPAVGSNLEDHFGVSLGFFIPMQDSLVSLRTQPLRFIIELLKYLIWGTGWLLGPVLQLAIFAHSKMLDDTGKPMQVEKPSEKLPDIEVMPMAYASHDEPAPLDRGMFSFLNVLLHPKSKGTVRLASTDPRAPLVIDPRYLSNPDDFAPLRSSLKLSMRLRDEMRARGYALEDWLKPKSESDADLDDYIRRYNRTTYHYSSTCRMAPEDDANGGGVVDDELKVYGVENLRVADTSILPRVLGTHLQAPAVAIGEKGADMILKAATT